MFATEPTHYRTDSQLTGYIGFKGKAHKGLVNLLNILFGEKTIVLLSGKS